MSKEPKEYTDLRDWYNTGNPNPEPSVFNPEPHNGPHGDLPSGQLGDMKKWYGEYIDSDVFRQRLINSGDYGTSDEIDEVIRERRKALENVSVTGGHESSAMFPKDSKMKLRDDDFGRRDVVSHEVGHTIGGSFLDTTHEVPFGERDSYGKRALSINDIKAFEDRNRLYRNAPYESIDVEGKTGRNYKGGADSQYTSGPDLVGDYRGGLDNVGSVRRGTPSIEAKRINRNLNQEDFNSTEEYVRNQYVFPEGYDENLKEEEIARLSSLLDEDNSRNKKQQSLNERYSKAKINIRNVTNREDMSVKDAISFKVEDSLDYINKYVLGSKDLKKKYRGMSLKDIPDGVNPEIDDYRKSLSLQKELQTSKKEFKDLQRTPYKETKPKAFTPKGGNAAVVKKGEEHYIGASENFADLVGVRQLIYDKFGKTPDQTVTEEEYKKLIEEHKRARGGSGVDIIDRWDKQHTPEDGLWLLNNIAMEEPEVKNGVTAKKGSSIKLKKKSKKDPRLAKNNLEGYNKPKKTPSHPTKSHVVLAKVGDVVKLIRFGEQGASTAGKPKAGESVKMKKKRASFKARHAKNIKKGRLSAAYWADKVKW